MMSTLKNQYAINKEVLRAVLNGFSIDMSAPCQIHIDNEMFGFKMMRDKRLQKQGHEHDSDRKSISDQPEFSPGSEDDYYEQN